MPASLVGGKAVVQADRTGQLVGGVADILERDLRQGKLESWNVGCSGGSAVATRPQRRAGTRRCRCGRCGRWRCGTLGSGSPRRHDNGAAAVGHCRPGGREVLYDGRQGNPGQALSSRVSGRTGGVDRCRGLLVGPRDGWAGSLTTLGPAAATSPAADPTGASTGRVVAAPHAAANGCGCYSWTGSPVTRWSAWLMVSWMSRMRCPSCRE